MSTDAVREIKEKMTKAGSFFDKQGFEEVSTISIINEVDAYFVVVQNAETGTGEAHIVFRTRMPPYSLMSYFVQDLKLRPLESGMAAEMLRRLPPPVAPTPKPAGGGVATVSPSVSRARARAIKAREATMGGAPVASTAEGTGLPDEIGVEQG